MVAAQLEQRMPEDIRAMEWALDDMRAARRDARAFLDANMRLHLAIARASRIELLASFYESIVTLPSAAMTKATFVADPGELLEYNLQVDADLIIAIRDQNTTALQKLLTLHHQDTIRVT